MEALSWNFSAQRQPHCRPRAQHRLLAQLPVMGSLPDMGTNQCFWRQRKPQMKKAEYYIFGTPATRNPVDSHNIPLASRETSGLNQVPKSTVTSTEQGSEHHL